MTQPNPSTPTPGGVSAPARSVSTPPIPHDGQQQAGWRSQDILRTAALVTAMYIGVRLLWFAHPLLFVAFLGTLFGLAVTAGVDRLERFRIPRGLAAALIVFGSLGVVVGFFAWTAPTLRAQSRELRVKLPESIDKLDAWLEAHRGGLVGMFLSDSESSPGTNPNAARPAASAGVSPTSAGQRGDSLAPVSHDPSGKMRPAPDSLGAGSELRHKLLRQFKGASRFVFPFVTSTVAAFAGVLMLIFFSIYIAAEPQTYHDGIMHLFPHRARPRAGEVLTQIATVLRKWLLTQLIAMVAMGVVTTVLLLLLRVKAAFPLGILAGLFEFIPTLGPIVSSLPAIAMGFVDSPQKAMWVTIVYIAIHFLESHLLIPLLMKDGVDLPPALTIMAQAIMALIFGFIGLLIAVPFLAAVMVAVKMLYVEDVVGDATEVREPGAGSGLGGPVTDTPG